MAAKVHFTKDLDELSHFVSLDHIPKDMGGKEDWKYSFVPPVKGENAEMEKTQQRDQLLEKRAALFKDYEGLTQQWLRGDGGTATQQRKELTDRLRSDYWQLDPYVRARTYWDRTGVIKPDGRLDFYPSAEQQSAGNGGPIPAGHIDDGGVD